jgi:hypothetical protein
MKANDQPRMHCLGRTFLIDNDKGPPNPTLPLPSLALFETFQYTQVAEGAVVNVGTVRPVSRVKWLCHFCRDSSSIAVALYSASIVVVAFRHPSSTYVFVMPSFPLPPHGTIRPESNKTTFPVAALHRFSTLLPYTIEQPVVFFPIIGPAQCLVHDASFIPNVPSKVIHQYTLTSRGRDYALITVTSRHF